MYISEMKNEFRTNALATLANLEYVCVQECRDFNDLFVPSVQAENEL